MIKPSFIHETVRYMKTIYAISYALDIPFDKVLEEIRKRYASTGLSFCECVAIIRFNLAKGLELS